MPAKPAFEAIRAHVARLPIIDTHEHLPPREAQRERPTDLLREYLSHYFSCDLVSAGLSRQGLDQARDPKLPLMSRWKLIAPYWEAARHTGYGRALDLTVERLYGAKRIDGSTLEGLDKAFQRTLRSPGHFKKVLKDHCKIEISLLDRFVPESVDSDPSFFLNIFRADPFIFPPGLDFVREVELRQGRKVKGLDAWLEAFEAYLARALKKGLAGFKCGLAYERSLHFGPCARKDAESQFKSFLSGKRRRPEKGFQDFMMREVLARTTKTGLTYQFHTGLLEGNGGLIANSDPSLLSQLFLEFPDQDFDLFHMGYPYQHMLSALAKNFRNVFIDMCWAHIISPEASVRALVEWLDAVPANKISAFGGDYLFVDAVYGHQHLARFNVSKALAIKVDDGVFGMDRAKEIAEMLFYGNPKKIFKLPT